MSEKISQKVSEAKLKIDKKEYNLPILEGTEGEKALDITKLRATTGHITFDPGYKNTGATQSNITFLDGEKGILRYRGYPIEQICEGASFLEVAYLLIYGHRPSKEQAASFQQRIDDAADQVPESIADLLSYIPRDAHPMQMLSILINALGCNFPDEPDNLESMEESYINLLAKTPVVAAWIYRHIKGLSFLLPLPGYTCAENFLYMMFASDSGEYTIKKDIARSLDQLLILHADHEQNCSTASVRMIGSSHASLYASISGGVGALSGKLHGGANQAVIEMLERIHNQAGDIVGFMEGVKQKKERLMGFGHRVYKNFDPRAQIIKKACDTVLENLGVQSELLGIAQSLEKIALEDEYFIKRNLYPNVDFYSGIIYSALNIPTNMFTVLFAMGRLPGWIAQWKELRETNQAIRRPRQVYMGETERNY